MSGGAPAGRRPRRLWPAVATVALVALGVSLGQWQLRRADEKRDLQARVDAARRAPPIALPVEPVLPAQLDGRSVLVRGHFAARHTVWIDNRSRKGVAGFHVVTPVRIEGSTLHVLVLRGWAPRDPRERTRLPQVATPADEVAIEGVAEAEIAQALELAAAPTPGPEDRIWQNLDFDRFEQWSGLRVQRVLVRQLDPAHPQEGLVRDWPEPGGDVDKHLGYAFQWFTMAAVVLGLWLYFTFRQRRDDNTDPS